LVIEQRQTILNMYNSGIVPEVIALQMDKSKEEIIQIIDKTKAEEEEKKKNKKNKRNKVGLSLSSSEAEVKKDSNIPLITKVYFDKTVNIDYAIKNAQSRMWKALTVKSDFNISMEETQNALNNYAESKATFVILHIDLVDSTKLSMTLPVNRLVTIIQAFSQEMSVILAAYGGYVLKYIGDAVLAFFVVDSPNNLYLRCINALECACSMIKVVRQGINPILNQYDYPELSVRIGIDVGENAVVQFGWDTYTSHGKVIMKRPHFDILGYTISIATKMTTFAKPDQIVIGQLVYDVLEDKQSTFRLMQINPQIWDYFSNNTGGIYHLYSSLNESEYKEYTDSNLKDR
jgi:adenylate cyclase